MALETAVKQLVTIKISNNVNYNYDVQGEFAGEHGTISLADPVHSRLDIVQRFETRYAPDWRTRHAKADRRRNRDPLRLVETGGEGRRRPQRATGTSAAPRLLPRQT